MWLTLLIFLSNFILFAGVEPPEKYFNVLENRKTVKESIPEELRVSSKFFTDTTKSVKLISSLIPSVSSCPSSTDQQKNGEQALLSCKSSTHKPDFITLSFDQPNSLPSGVKIRYEKVYGKDSIKALKAQPLSLFVSVDDIKKNLGPTQEEKKLRVKRIKKELLKFDRTDEVCDSTFSILSKNDNLMPFLLVLSDILEDGDDLGYTHSQEVKLSKSVKCKKLKNKVVSNHIQASISSGLVTEAASRYYSCEREGVRCRDQYAIDETDVRLGVSRKVQKGNTKVELSGFLGNTHYNDKGIAKDSQDRWHGFLRFVGGPKAAFKPVNRAVDINFNNTYAGLAAQLSQSVMLGETCRVTFEGSGSVTIGTTGVVTTGKLTAAVQKRVKDYVITAHAGVNVTNGNSIILNVSEELEPGEERVNIGDRETEIQPEFGLSVSNGLTGLNFTARKNIGSTFKIDENDDRGENIYLVSMDRKTGKVKKKKSAAVEELDERMAIRFAGLDDF